LRGLEKNLQAANVRIGCIHIVYFLGIVGVICITLIEIEVIFVVSVAVIF
jgi:hypothetical protein